MRVAATPYGLRPALNGPLNLKIRTFMGRLQAPSLIFLRLVAIKLSKVQHIDHIGISILITIPNQG